MDYPIALFVVVVVFVVVFKQNQQSDRNQENIFCIDYTNVIKFKHNLLLKKNESTGQKFFKLIFSSSQNVPKYT